jgi:hypothetical protein
VAEAHEERAKKIEAGVPAEAEREEEITEEGRMAPRSGERRLLVDHVTHGRRHIATNRGSSASATIDAGHRVMNAGA